LKKEPLHHKTLKTKTKPSSSTTPNAKNTPNLDLKFPRVTLFYQYGVYAL
jgi:hypothetical protein